MAKKKRNCKKLTEDDLLILDWAKEKIHEYCIDYSVEQPIVDGILGKIESLKTLPPPVKDPPGGTNP